MSDFLARISHFSPKRLALLADELNSRVEQLEQVASRADRDRRHRLPFARRRRHARANSGSWCATASTRSPRCRAIAGTSMPCTTPTPTRRARWPLAGAASCRASMASIRTSSASRRARRRAWTRSSGCCWRWRGRRSRTLRFPPSASPAAAPASSSACRRATITRCCAEPGTAAFDAYTASGVAHSIASGRLSYVLGARGPSLAIDTACSSSLVAIHEAVHSLRRGESDMALAGGVNLILRPDVTIALSRSHMMAPDGRCKAFDARADGFVRSEGCGVLVLKRLSDAEADGDRILALIRGVGGQSGRPQQRPDRAQRPVAGSCAARRAGRRAGRCRSGRLCRGPRHRHVARRSDRGAGAGTRCLAAGAASAIRCWSAR